MLQSGAHFETVVIGGGQAGLAVGHALQTRGLPFVILDAHARIGDAWRTRWDSLHLFSPARFDGLPGLAFPGPAYRFPSKDEMADYLEAYARTFDLPVHTGARVDRLSRHNGRFVIDSGDARIEADNVVVAMSNWQKPRVPPFAASLGAGIKQLHSSEYRSPAQLRDGRVLIVGAGNSGAEIALDVARTHQTIVAGRDTGQVPFPINAVTVRVLLPVLFRVFFHWIATVRTPIGRRIRASFVGHAMPLIRTRQQNLRAAGVERAPKVVGARGGLPLLEDERVLDVANVIWCTGYSTGFSWIDVPNVDQERPMQDMGVVANEPGLFFVGLEFLYAASSSMIHGVGRDAERVAKAVAARQPVVQPRTSVVQFAHL